MTDANPELTAERLTRRRGRRGGARIESPVQMSRERCSINAIVNPVSSVSLPGDARAGDLPGADGENEYIRAENLGKTFAPGFEIDWLAQITDRFQLSGGYQYVDAKVISAPASSRSW